MDQLKANYDRVLLLLAGLLLIAVSLYAARGLSSIPEAFPTPPARTSGAPFEPEAALASLQIEAPKAKDASGTVWQEQESSLFVSRVYLLRESALVDILESETELVPGIANAWILKYKLDYTNRDLAQGDPDSDGFSNAEEFRAGTDPTDANSTPAAWSKLRLASSKIEKLRTKFESLPQGDLKVVQINTVSSEDPSALTGVSKFYQLGDAIVLSETSADGRPMTVETPLTFQSAKIIRRRNEKINSEEEVPQITLVSSVDGMEIELVQGEVKDSPYSLATLQDTKGGGQSYALRSGQEFELGPGQRYKLIDVSAEAATIKELSSGEQHTIPHLATDATLPPQIEQ